MKLSWKKSKWSGGVYGVNFEQPATTWSNGTTGTFYYCTIWYVSLVALSIEATCGLCCHAATVPRSTDLHPQQCRWLARHSQIALAAVMIQAQDGTSNQWHHSASHLIDPWLPLKNNTNIKKALRPLDTTKKSCHSLVFQGNSTTLTISCHALPALQPFIFARSQRPTNGKDQWVHVGWAWTNLQMNLSWT